MQFHKKIHITHLMEGHRKLLRGGGLKSEILEAKYEAKLEFPGGRGGGGGCKTKTPSMGEYGYFWNCTFWDFYLHLLWLICV